MTRTLRPRGRILGKPSGLTLPARSPRRSRRRSETWTGYAFTLPALVGIVLFGLLPLVFAAVVSLFRFDPVAGERAFIGFGNYGQLLRDTRFWRALGNTAYYALMLIPAQTVLGLGLALLVQQATRGVTFFRSIYYLPVVSSMVVASTLWRIMYDSDNGILNSLLGAVGLPPQPFLTSPSQAMPALAVMSTWKWTGISMLVFLGGLNAIPAEYHEAAEIDGAGRVGSFFHVTLPLLRRSALFVIVMNTVNAFKLFTPIYIITQGGPRESTVTLVFHIFRTGFRHYAMGYASAMSVLVLLIVLGLTLVQSRLLRSEAEL